MACNMTTVHQTGDLVEEKDGENPVIQDFIGEDDTKKSHPSPPTLVDILPIEVSLLRFLVLLVISWLFSYAAMSANAQWVVETYMPWSFWMLHFLVIVGIVGGGWPLAAPLGTYGEAYWDSHGRLAIDVAQTGLVIALASAASAFFVKVWPAYPLSPAGVWFGIGLFWMTLWFVLCVQLAPAPLIPHFSFPLLNMAICSIVIILMAIALFQFVDYEEPVAMDSSNPEGPIKGSYWFSLAASIIVWVHVFSNILVFQGWPFSLVADAGHPFVAHVALLSSSVLLGWGVLETVRSLDIDRDFYTNAVMVSQISWSLFHTVALDFWPFHRLVQPVRGNILLLAITGCFALLLGVDLPHHSRTNLRRNGKCQCTVRYSLYHSSNDPMVHPPHDGPLLLFHQSFFMRWPLPPPGPPLRSMDRGVVMKDFMDPSYTSELDEQVELIASVQRPQKKASQLTGIEDDDGNENEMESITTPPV